MKNFSYKKVGKEIGWSFVKINCKTEYLSNYNYYQTVVSNIKQNQTIMLDIGCGSGEKAVKYYSFAKHVEMVDLEEEMLKKVHENIEKYYKGNSLAKKFITKKVNSNGKLPYKDCLFDLIVARHAPKNMEEVFRVLKKDGIFISEDIDENDCLELKEIFNCGQGFDAFKNGIRLKQTIINKAIHLGFSKIQLINFGEIEYYKAKKDLEFLLEHTPILEGVDDYKKKIDEYISKYTTKKGIVLNRKLYALTIIK